MIVKHIDLIYDEPATAVTVQVRQPKLSSSNSPKKAGSVDKPWADWCNSCFFSCFDCQTIDEHC